jgi:hypothetical protein
MSIAVSATCRPLMPPPFFAAGPLEPELARPVNDRDWDVGLHIDLPLVLSDASSLDFDRSESNCIYPESPEAVMGAGRWHGDSSPDSDIGRQFHVPGLQAPPSGSVLI